MAKRQVFYLLKQRTDSSFGFQIPGHFDSRQEAIVASATVDCAPDEEIIVDSRYIRVRQVRRTK